MSDSELSQASARTTRRPGRLRRSSARAAVLALVAASVLVLTTVSAGADAPDVATATGSAVDNNDGTVTLTVQGTWTWPTHVNKNCNVDRWGVGWAVDWKDPNQPGNLVGTLDGVDIEVGTPTDNNVYFGSAPRCGVYGPHGAVSYNEGSWGPLSHTYDVPTGVDPQDFIDELSACAVTYDLHGKPEDPAPNKASELVAGGTGHNKDNSVEKNKQTPAGNVCAEIDVVPVDPDVAVVKEGPVEVIAGSTITYTITATNTGTVSTPVVIVDEVPAGTTFVSATPPCEIEENVVTCAVGTLDPGQSAQVQITVLTSEAGTVTNTAIVSPDDETPEDNTSTVVTQVLAPGADVVTPAPAAPVAVSPKLTG